MNRYPLWKYILIGIVLIIGLVYTLPNFYGESPAVQVTSGKATVKVTEQTLSQVETALANANLKPNGLFFEQGAQQNTIRVRFDPTQTEEQLRAREVIEKALNSDPKDPSHIVALNLVPNTPQWLLSINALPMYLGLDLRGGVHFLLQVDMRAALTKRADAIAADLHTQLRDKRIRPPASAVSATMSKSVLRGPKNVIARTTCCAARSLICFPRYRYWRRSSLSRVIR